MVSVSGTGAIVQNRKRKSLSGVNAEQVPFGIKNLRHKSVLANGIFASVDFAAHFCRDSLFTSAILASKVDDRIDSAGNNIS